MKYILMGIIRLYWFLIPANRRRRCLFRKSCSKAVFEEAKNKGFFSAYKVFKYRLKNCRPGYELYIDPIEGSTQLILNSKDILNQIQIAEWMLNK